MTVLVVTAMVVVAALELVHIRGMLYQQQAVARLTDRVEQVRAAVSLLTDTTETGFRDLAIEVGRHAAVAEPPRSRTQVAKRIAGGLRRGRALGDIAADEQMSEGEARLRMTLAATTQGRKARRAPLQ